jgi:hypothetical protein
MRQNEKKIAPKILQSVLNLKPKFAPLMCFHLFYLGIRKNINKGNHSSTPNFNYLSYINSNLWHKIIHNPNIMFMMSIN